jgi:hypothetical protein
LIIVVSRLPGMTSHQKQATPFYNFSCGDMQDDAPRKRNAKRKESAWPRVSETSVSKTSYARQLTFLNSKCSHAQHRVDGRERFLDRLVDKSGLPNLVHAYHTSSRIYPSLTDRLLEG